jgi:succinate-acetate transporter protein
VIAVDDATRIVLRPIANPLPLGFLALAGGTIVVSALQLGWIPPTEGTSVALILLAFVAPLQLLAAVFGFLARDVVASTGMGVLTGTWLSVALVQLHLPIGGSSKALGILLVLSSVAMGIAASGAAMGKVVPAVVLATTSLRFLATGLAQLTGSSRWEDVAGIAGVVLCIVAVYAATALVVDDVRRSTTLPLLRRGRGRDALTGDVRAQIAGIEHEPGVREQL